MGEVVETVKRKHDEVKRFIFKGRHIPSVTTHEPDTRKSLPASFYHVRRIVESDIVFAD
jgi:hypothetical protein